MNQPPLSTRRASPRALLLAASLAAALTGPIAPSARAQVIGSRGQTGVVSNGAAAPSWQGWQPAPAQAPFFQALGVTLDTPARVESFGRVMARAGLAPAALSADQPDDQKKALVAGSVSQYSKRLVGVAAWISPPGGLRGRKALDGFDQEFDDLSSVPGLAPADARLLLAQGHARIQTLIGLNEGANAEAIAARVEKIRKSWDIRNAEGGLSGSFADAVAAAVAAPAPTAHATGLRKPTPGQTKASDWAPAAPPAPAAEPSEMPSAEQAPGFGHLAVLWEAVSSLADAKDQDRIIRQVFPGQSFPEGLADLSEVQAIGSRDAAELVKASLFQLQQVASNHEYPSGRRRAAAAVIAQYGGDADREYLKVRGRHTMGRAMNQLARSPASLEPSMAGYIVARQDQIEKLLQARYDHYGEMNAPPAPWKTWSELSSRLPPQARYAFVRKVLKQAGGNATKVAARIALFEPTDDVRRAVLDFLHESGYIEETQIRLSSDQIRLMFGTPERFQAFFPWIFPHVSTAKNAHLHDQLVVAAKTAPDKSTAVDSDWFKGMLGGQVGEGEADIIGFRPAVSYADLAGKVGNDFQFRNSRVTPEAEIRGLTVQSGYERSKNSMIGRLDQRGGGQVEEDAARMMRGLSASLKDGRLSKESPLVRRQFVYGWAVHADDSLIQEIRQLALDVTEKDQNFYPLRVEVHNFPTLDVLERVKEYRKTQQAKLQGGGDKLLDRLIAKMEQFLMVSASAGTAADPEEEVASLLKSRQGRPTFAMKVRNGMSKVKAALNADAWDTLFTLGSNLHDIFNPPFSDVDSYMQDRNLSERAMAAGVRLVETLKPPKTAADLSHLVAVAHDILGHVAADDMLSGPRAAAINEELDRINADPALPLEHKTDLILKLVSNAAEQVQYELTQEFGKWDHLYQRVVPRKGAAPVLYVDSLLRSGNVFLLGRLVDNLQTQLVAGKGIEHKIGGRTVKAPVEVYNPGTASGILRLDKNPMELTRDEIAVFKQFPSETAALGGIVTLGVGARLSHLQLLAKALGVPNVKVAPEFLAELKKLDGKRVVLTAGKDGRLSIEEIGSSHPGAAKAEKAKVEIPVPDFTAQTPVTFSEAAKLDYPRLAGPKGIQLSRMFNDPTLHDSVPDGFMLPFGFFKRYAEKTGLWTSLRMLGSLRVDQSHLVSVVCAKIREQIAHAKLPDDMRQEAATALGALKARTGHKEGFFFRSDTNMEDLPNFNGAGLNESIPNVPVDEAAVDQAIRQVWMSAFEEKSVFWRAAALSATEVPVAMPSIVVMPTVSAEASGVVISRGTAAWERGKGVISADRGISSVVSGATPVEEIDLAGSAPHRYGFTVSSTKNVINPSGGLSAQKVPAGTPVLSPDQIKQINALAQSIDRLLGDEPHGWDIEWAVNTQGKIIILQARPNM